MTIKHLISTLALGATLAFGSTAASAALLPFCVDDTGYGGVVGGGNQVACAGAGSQTGETGFSADLLQGAYVEKLKVTSATTFSATIVFDINNYSYLGDAVDSSPLVGLGIPYDLYAVVVATGTFSGTAFTVTSSTVELYADVGNNSSTSMSSIDSTTLAYTGGDAGDQLLGSSTFLLGGGGNLGASGGTDGFAVTYGQFALTSDGESFFIAPRPFHVNVYSDGDITDPSFSGTVGTVFEFQGEASANFLQVPEPGSLALVGMALMGLGAARRRKA